MNDDIIDSLKQILKDDLLVDADLGSIKEDDALQSVVGLDSVGFVELRVACEQRLKVEITDDQFNSEHFHSLGALARLIETLRAEGSR
jgi:acyl carrier protein